MRRLYAFFLLPLLFTSPLSALEEELAFCADRVIEKGVVHVVYFYSPKCPYCHKVMDDDLKPMTRKYGDTLNVVMVNIDTPEGQEIFQNAMRKYSIPKSRRVVPFMVIGTTTLIGSEEIKRRLRFLIDKGLSAGGKKLPQIQGLEGEE